MWPLTSLWPLAISSTIALLATDRQTNKQTDRQTKGHYHYIKHAFVAVTDKVHHAVDGHS